MNGKDGPTELELGFSEPEVTLIFSFPQRKIATLDLCKWCRNFDPQQKCPQLLKNQICCSFESISNEDIPPLMEAK